MRPLPVTYPAYFNNYIKLVPEDDIITGLINQTSHAVKIFNSITEEQSKYRYDEDKWSIKQILQHISDTERIFCYRALAFARKDQNILPSFDENSYANHSNADQQQWAQLLEEFEAVRKSTHALFRSFTPEQLHSSGKVSDYSICVLALAYTTIGHTTHHINIIRERYLDV